MQKKLLIKILAIAFIGLLLLIPIAMIEGKIRERSAFKDEARWKLQESWTRAQNIVTPILVQPYVIERQTLASRTDNGDPVYRTRRETKLHFIIPEQLEFESTINTEVRHQGIYGIPVYTAELTMAGQFANATLVGEINSLKNRSDFVELLPAYTALNISDMRGLSGLPTLSWNGGTVELQPNTRIPSLSDGLHADITLPESGDIPFTVQLQLRGLEEFSLIPVAANANISMNSDWPHPQFSGAFLPTSRKISTDGFQAQWQVNHYSTGIKDKLALCSEGDCSYLQGISFGTRLFNSVDVYQQTERSTKYALLFIGLTFISFFVLETLKNLRIHPIQYSLVGFAIAVFFLLLLSLSEHIAFGLSYFIASTACISLIGYYLHFALKSWAVTGIFVGAYSGLYGLLFCIVRAEDYALLMGSILIFAVLAAMMITTRTIDWYNLNRNERPQTA